MLSVDGLGVAGEVDILWGGLAMMIRMRSRLGEWYCTRFDGGPKLTLKMSACESLKQRAEPLG